MLYLTNKDRKTLTTFPDGAVDAALEAMRDIARQRNQATMLFYRKGADRDSTKLVAKTKIGLLRKSLVRYYGAVPVSHRIRKATS